MSTKADLLRQRKEANDEYYTLYEDVVDEIQHYKESLKGKVVYCNRDTERSNFVQYFKEQKENLGLAGFLYSSVDFRSEESIEKLKACDIVITNPPFSLAKEFFKQLFEYKKDFIIVGRETMTSYRDLYDHFANGDIQFGYTKIRYFITPKEMKMLRNAAWFTSLPIKKDIPFINLTRHYTPEEYPKYDDYDAINVDRYKDIPGDYYGAMGVPITFLKYWNREQFELAEFGHNDRYHQSFSDKCYVNGKHLYNRICIKRKVKKKWN